MLAFGPDDYLYIAFGDGGDGGDPDNNGQDRSTLHGNILRIDVHPINPADAYDIPADNPFIGMSDVAPEIYAYGLRNPFRFSFDSQDGTLWLGDVGQDVIEEIDIIESGGNYGWRVFEGTQSHNRTGNSLPDSAFTPPVFEYDHSEGRAVVGGYVYRGSAFPALLGQYLFADYSSGSIWSLSWDGSTVTNRTTLTTASNPTSFAEKSDGELLVVTQTAGVFALEVAGGSNEDLPDLLSETGLFTNLEDLTPASGLVEYTLNQPFWSDGASKRRWLGVPNGQQIAFSNDDWSFPAGSVLVKHFEINTPNGLRRLETRVLLNRDGAWLGLTYKWRIDGTDAELQLGRELEPLTVVDNEGNPVNRTYEFPSRTDCFVCHTTAADTVLGLRTPQLNRNFDYAVATDNQLRSLNNINLFDADIGAADGYTSFPGLDASTAAIASRARTYLDVNCASCHQPNGTTQSLLDFRFTAADDDMNAIDVTPQLGDLGLTDARLIAPGDRNRSVVWARMNQRGNNQMPPLGSHVVDEAGVSVVGQWIDTLPTP